MDGFDSYIGYEIGVHNKYEGEIKIYLLKARLLNLYL